MRSASRERPGLLERLRDRDHTQSSLLGSVLVLALPAIAMSTVAMAGFQIVELRFLGLLGEEAIAAAGSTNQTLRQAMMLLMMGLMTATQMVIARLVGARQHDAAEHVAGQSFVLGAASWIVCIFTVGLFPEPFVRLFSSPEIVPLGAAYIRIVFLTFGVMTAVQLFGGILQGAGDTTTPALISIGTLPVSIFAEWALAFGHFGLPALGIRGIAVGAAVGGSFGVAVSLWVLFAGRTRVHLRTRHLLPDRAAMAHLIGNAWQPALHMTARSLLVVFFMWRARDLGASVQAAYTIGLRVEMIPVMVAFPVANACATLVGQNLGAAQPRRAWRSIGVSIGTCFVFLWPMALALGLGREAIAAFFTDDPVVIAEAAQYMLFNAISMSFYGIYFVCYRSLQAAGDMNVPMLISVATAVLIGAPIGYVLSQSMGATGMWIGHLCYTIVNTVAMAGWLLTGRWARRPRTPMRVAAEAG